VRGFSGSTASLGSRRRAQYRKGVKKTENAQRIISLVLKAVALGMAVVSIVLGFLPEAADISTQVTLLSIGLFTLALAALQKEE
jgi:uncharacterized membrane protein YwzB